MINLIPLCRGNSSVSFSETYKQLLLSGGYEIISAESK
jgi:hypothetical protein